MMELTKEPGGDTALSAFDLLLSFLARSAGPERLRRMAFGCIPRHAARAIATLVLIAGVCGCAPTMKLKSDEDLRQFPLSSTVSIQTILDLLSFAVKDRECASVPDPVRLTIHPTPYEGYAHCVYASSRTFCDANIEDIHSLAKLLALDPRLASIASFDDVRLQVSATCGWGKQDPRRALPLRIAKRIERCEWNPEQPILNAWGVNLRQPIAHESAAEVGRAVEWARPCAAAKGFIFLNDHCFRIGRRVSSYGLPAEPFNIRKLGTEDYFCHRSV